jgi:23S rRNA (guanosine2251-2'-O)-methyltransferase
LPPVADNGVSARSARRDGEPEPQWVYGIHPVMELLENRGAEVDRVFVVQGRHAGLGRLLRLAREIGVPISHLTREVLARKVGKQAVHQGVAAQVAPLAYADAGELCAKAAADPCAMLVLVDRVVDPRNLGAILRTSAAAGATGVLLAADATVGVTPVVCKASAGATERVPIAREAKPAKRIESLRDSGFRAVGLDPRGHSAWHEETLTGRVLFIAGGEAGGPRPSVLRACDHRLAIPMAGGVESLNVAIALGVLLFEAVRQRGASPTTP